MSKNNLINRYVESAKLHGKGSEIGDNEMVREGYAEISAIYAELKKKRAMAVLLPLLKDKDETVRLWASAHLLPTKNDIAVQVLTDIAKGKGLAAFDAGVILKEWESGKLAIEVLNYQK